MTLPALVRDYVDARLKAELGISLKDYIDRCLDDLELARAQAHGSLEQRLESMNEFRAQLDKQAGTFINRAEHDHLCERVSDLERNRARLEGRSSLSVVLAVMGVIVSILALLERVFIK